MNQLLLVGRLTRDPELKRVNNTSNCFITIAVKRQYKNSMGIYESDFISCSVWNVIAERVCEYCHKGDMISVKARIQSVHYTNEDGKDVYTYEIVADQVAFMQSPKKNEEDGLEEELINAE